MTNDTIENQIRIAIQSKFWDQISNDGYFRIHESCGFYVTSMIRDQVWHQVYGQVNNLILNQMNEN
jgi:hypothetical protein